MTLTILNVEQGTEAWHDARRGMVTASTIGRLITSSHPTAQDFNCPACYGLAGHPCISKRDAQPIKTMHPERTNLATEHKRNNPPTLTTADTDDARGLTATLVAERLTGETEETPITNDMWRGIEMEPFARDTYSGHYQHAEQAGFMVRDDWGFELGFSPDGLVGTDGLIEIKCPRAKGHLLTILADEIPAQYVPQLQAGLLVSGRKWADFVSFRAGLPLFVKRVYPDPAWQEAIVAAVHAFEDKAARMVADYRARTATLPKTERLDFEIKVA